MTTYFSEIRNYIFMLMCEHFFMLCTKMPTHFIFCCHKCYNLHTVLNSISFSKMYMHMAWRFNPTLIIKVPTFLFFNVWISFALFMILKSYNPELKLIYGWKLPSAMENVLYLGCHCLPVYVFVFVCFSSKCVCASWVFVVFWMLVCCVNGL